MIMVRYANSPLLLWPEILMIALGVSYLVASNFVSFKGAAADRVRALSFVGFLNTASAVLLVSNPSYYSLITIPIIPGLFIFVALIFKPSLAEKWTNIKGYLTICAVLSTLVWGAQFLRLLKA